MEAAACLNIILNPDSGYSKLCPEARLLERFQVLMERDYLVHRGQEYYCEALGVSYYYLNLVTGKFFGKSVHMLLQERLFLESKRLVLNTAMSAKSIAYHLEFSDPSNFIKFFKGFSGYTPKTYRKLMQQ